MGYGEQPYDRFVTDLRAFAPDGSALTVKREEGPRWTLCSAGQSLARIEYEVDLARMEDAVLSASDASKWREGYASLLGYSVFAFVEGLESGPVRLEVRESPRWPLETESTPRPGCQVEKSGWDQRPCGSSD
jgi:predicted metalloprotease with PDZ domain